MTVGLRKWQSQHLHPKQHRNIWMWKNHRLLGWSKLSSTQAPNELDEKLETLNKKASYIDRKMLLGQHRMLTIRIAILVWLFLSLQPLCVSASFPFVFFSLSQSYFLSNPQHPILPYGTCRIRQCQCKLCAPTTETNAGTD